MINRLRERIPPETLRYIIAGCATTVINFVLFATLTRVFAIDDRTANLVSISVAIAFAFVVNKLYVFRSKSKKRTLPELVIFIGGRVFTMGVEYYGYIAIMALANHDLFAKAATQIVVFVLNYIISKLLVFRKRK